MKNNHVQEDWYHRFLRWAGGEEPEGAEGPEDPERAEFQEYLEYIEAHGYMEFGAYRLMRFRQRREKGLEDPGVLSTVPQLRSRSRSTHPDTTARESCATRFCSTGCSARSLSSPWRPSFWWSPWICLSLAGRIARR